MTETEAKTKRQKRVHVHVLEEEVTHPLTLAQEHHAMYPTPSNEIALLSAWRDRLTAKLADGSAHFVNATGHKIQFHGEDATFKHATEYLYRTKLMGAEKTCGPVWYDMLRKEIRIETEQPSLAQLFTATATIAGYCDFINEGYTQCECGKTTEVIVSQHEAMMRFATRYVGIDFALAAHDDRLPFPVIRMPRADELVPDASTVVTVGRRYFEVEEDVVGAAVETAVATQSNVTPKAEEEGKDSDGSGGGGSKCVVCQKAPVETVLLPCAHACMCRGCGRKVQSHKCPMCRKQVGQVIRIFLP